MSRSEREHKRYAHEVAVTFRVGENTYKGTGRVVDTAAEPDLTAAVSALMDAKYEWSDGLIVELSPGQGG